MSRIFETSLGRSISTPPPWSLPLVTSERGPSAKRMCPLFAHSHLAFDQQKTLTTESQGRSYAIDLASSSETVLDVYRILRGLDSIYVNITRCERPWLLKWLVLLALAVVLVLVVIYSQTGSAERTGSGVDDARERPLPMHRVASTL